MDVITLSRIQFAATSIYHFFFVPLTLGLAILVAIMETRYVRTGNEAFLRMTKFWGKLFVINFAMGVVTGIVQEFHFGLNWSEYSRFVGDIFGAPLAIEALLAFFLESTFLGVWIFGWERLSKGVHLLAIWLVALGSTVSALWILIANSFMQNPVGYSLEGTSKAVMTNFMALLGNPYLPGQFFHTLASAFATAAFFIIAISAYHLWRKKEEEVFERSFKLGSWFALGATLALLFIGHYQALEIMKYNPMKMIASEGAWNAESPASMSILTITNQAEEKNIVDIRVPYVLGLLVDLDPMGEVEGINQIEKQYEDRFGTGYYVPPIQVTNISFRIMVGVGFLLILVSALCVLQMIRKKPLRNLILFRFFPWLFVLPFLATTSGWILTEMGRQPWIVFGLLKTEDAVSPNLTPGMVLTTLIGFVLVYAVLMVADIYLLTKFAKAGPEPEIGKIEIEEPLA
jgi:cytochrome bd ubiquinol oxidase subunit I